MSETGGLLSGRFARFCQGNMFDMEIVTGDMILGKDALADLTDFIDGAFRQEDCHLTEFLIRSFTY